jgi:hypothetical protein
VLRNGAHVQWNYQTGQLVVRVGTGVDTYCNVLEIPRDDIRNVNGWIIVGGNRGYNHYPPNEYLMTSGNAFHHNTVIWDAGSTGASGWWLSDAANQPNYFTNNQRPDHNEYHMSGTVPRLIYDNNTTQKNTRKTFSEYQAAGADVHGTADTNYTSGFPRVSITSPADGTSFTNSVTVKAGASDKSGVNRVEFYVDWKLQTTVAGPPFNFDWTNGNTGTHTVAAMAYSNAGIRSCYAVTLKKQ